MRWGYALLVLLALGALALAVLVLHARGRPGGGVGAPATTQRQEPHRRRRPPPQRPRRVPVDWPTYGYDAARTHSAPFRLRPPFRVLWKQHGDRHLIEFPPVIVGGRLYIATNRGLVLALDAASGRVLWRHPLGRCTASSPAVAGGVLVIGAMGPLPHCDGDAPTFVAGLDLRDGHTRWLFRVRTVESSPLAVGRLVVFGSWDGRVDALDAKSGRLRWSARTNGPVKAGAARLGSVLYIGSYDGSMYALDARTGRVRWSAPAGAPFYATPAVAEGRVIAATTDGVVHAFSARSGAALWSRRIGPFAYSAAAVAHGRAYVGSYDHRLYALDAASGRVLWTYTAPGPVSGAPTVLGRLVYFSSCGSCSRYESNPDARRTFAVDAETGKLVWKFPDGEYSPVVTDGVRLYLNGYTRLYALQPRR